MGCRFSTISPTVPVSGSPSRSNLRDSQLSNCNSHPASNCQCSTQKTQRTDKTLTMGSMSPPMLSIEKSGGLYNNGNVSAAQLKLQEPSRNHLKFPDLQLPGETRRIAPDKYPITGGDESSTDQQRVTPGLLRSCSLPAITWSGSKPESPPKRLDQEFHIKPKPINVTKRDWPAGSSRMTSKQVSENFQQPIQTNKISISTRNTDHHQTEQKPSYHQIEFNTYQKTSRVAHLGTQTKPISTETRQLKVLEQEDEGVERERKCQCQKQNQRAMASTARPTLHVTPFFSANSRPLLHEVSERNPSVEASSIQKLDISLTSLEAAHLPPERRNRDAPSTTSSISFRFHPARKVRVIDFGVSAQISNFNVRQRMRTARPTQPNMFFTLKVMSTSPLKASSNPAVNLIGSTSEIVEADEGGAQMAGADDAPVKKSSRGPKVSTQTEFILNKQRFGSTDEMGSSTPGKVSCKFTSRRNKHFRWTGSELQKERNSLAFSTKMRLGAEGKVRETYRKFRTSILQDCESQSERSDDGATGLLQDPSLMFLVSPELPEDRTTK